MLRLWAEAPFRAHVLTVLEDGHTITTSYPFGGEESGGGVSLERRLTATGIQLLRDELDATGLTFLASADYLPVDEPWDGTPSVLEVGLSGGGTVVINWLLFSEIGDDYWEPQPEAAALEALYARLYGPSAAYREAGMEMITYGVDATAKTQQPELPSMPLAGSDASPALAGSRRVCWVAARGPEGTPIYRGEALRPGNVFRGPAIAEYRGTTLVVPASWRAELDRYRNVHLSRAGDGGQGPGVGET